MENKTRNTTRILAYHQAVELDHETLQQISGAAAERPLSNFTTKPTADFRGNYDITIDGQW